METLVVLLRLGQYLGAVLLFGVPLFFALRMPGSRAAISRWPRGVLLAAAVLTAATALGGLVVQTAVIAGSLDEALKPATLSYMVFGSSLGMAFVLRAAAALLAAVLLLALRPGRGNWTLLALVGAAVSASLAWTGHGAATEGARGVVHLLSDIVHALAAGLWLGGLAALGLLLARRRGDPPDDRLAHAALAGFASLGTLAVGLLVATGLLNSWFLIGLDNAARVLESAYGGLLVLKLALFGGMLALAASNRYRLTPNLESALDDGEGLADAVRALRRSLGLESALAVALLLAVAVMGTLAPPAAMG